MTSKRDTTRAISKREQEHAEMLKAALSRPGVREVMKVYGNWREADHGLNAYREATKRTEWTATTDSTNKKDL